MKVALQRELLASLEATLQALARAHADAREGATHAEARPENDKDTRALEASYLARGQAMRVAALEAALAAVRTMPLPVGGEGVPAALGALIEAREGPTRLRFFLAPEGGGLRLADGVQVVTPRSPLGQALVGKRVGDEVEVTLAGRTRVLSLTRVQ